MRSFLEQDCLEGRPSSRVWLQECLHFLQLDGCFLHCQLRCKPCHLESGGAVRRFDLQLVDLLDESKGFTRNHTAVRRLTTQ